MVVSGLIPPGKAAAANDAYRAIAAVRAPVPRAGAEYANSLVLNDTGAQLRGWNQTSSYCPSSPGYIADGTVTTDASGAINLTTSGTPGSCVALISPGTFSSGVIEADLYLPPLPGKPHSIANWVGFWLCGANWPQDGELDAVEVEPVDGRNAVTFHSGTAAQPFVAATSDYFPTKLPVETANLTPGWHTVDIAFTRGSFEIYYDGKEFTSFTSSEIPGSPMSLYITMTSTPNNQWVQQHIGGPPINSDSSPATFSVKYLRIWSYK